MRSQPAVRRGDVVLVDFAQEAVKARAVVEMDEMGGLVRNYGTADCIGCLHQPPVDPHHALARATAPAALGAGQPGFDVSGIAGGPLAYNPASESGGKSFTLGGFDFSVSGAPQAGDALSIVNNTGGSGDNRNALALASLQTSNTLYGGTASFQAAYSGMVADIAVQTRQAETGSRTEGVLLEQAVASRESLSGVNLDEEAANLIRYQQAYQAAAQMIAVADQLFQTLLTATRR